MILKFKISINCPNDNTLFDSSRIGSIGTSCNFWYRNGRIKLCQKRHGHDRILIRTDTMVRKNRGGSDNEPPEN